MPCGWVLTGRGVATRVQTCSLYARHLLAIRLPILTCTEQRTENRDGHVSQIGSKGEKNAHTLAAVLGRTGVRRPSPRFQPNTTLAHCGCLFLGSASFLPFLRWGGVPHLWTRGVCVCMPPSCWPVVYRCLWVCLRPHNTVSWYDATWHLPPPSSSTLRVTTPSSTSLAPTIRGVRQVSRVSARRTGVHTHRMYVCDLDLCNNSSWVAGRQAKNK